MDYQTLVNIALFALGVGFAVLGWLGNELWSAVKTMQTDLSSIKEHIPTNYVTKSDFSDALAEIRRGLDRIYDKLDGKADKP